MRFLGNLWADLGNPIEKIAFVLVCLFMLMFVIRTIL